MVGGHREQHTKADKRAVRLRALSAVHVELPDLLSTGRQQWVHAETAPRADKSTDRLLMYAPDAA